MSSKKEEEKLFTLPVSYIMEQLQKTDEQIMGSELILQHFFDSQDQQSRFLIPMVVDILWLNYSIVRILTPHIENPTLVDNPDTGEREYIVDNSSLLGLQTLVLNRHHANNELKRLSCSIAMH
jgi:hypothetical protein